MNKSRNHFIGVYEKVDGPRSQVITRSDKRGAPEPRLVHLAQKATLAYPLYYQTPVALLGQRNGEPNYLHCHHMNTCTF